MFYFVVLPQGLFLPSEIQGWAPASCLRGLWGKSLKSLEGGSSNFRQSPQLLGQHRLSALPSHAQSLGTLFPPLNFPQTVHGGDRGPETEALRLALGHLRAGGLYGGLIP